MISVGADPPQTRPLNASVLLATWFGCGFFPWGPGTVGSLAAVLITFALERYLNLGRGALALLTVLLLWPAIWAATQTARIYRREDPGLVVVDEVLGQWVTLLAVPTHPWKVLLIGFVLFRIFDIWKPWPVRKLEELPEGVGIVADDLAAGLYGAVLLYTGSRIGLY